MKQMDYTFSSRDDLIKFIKKNDFQQGLFVQIYSSDQKLIDDISKTICTECSKPTITKILSEAIEQTKIQFTKITEHTKVLYDVKVSTCSNAGNEAVYAGIINTTTEGFWLLDSDLNITDVNFSLCRMLGYKKEELLNKKPFDFIDTNEQTHCKSQAELIDDISSRTYEMVFRRKDGSSLYGLVNATTMHDHDDQLKTFAFITDISKQKVIEEELRSQQEAIEKLNDTLEQKVAEEVEKNREKDQMMYQQSRLASMGEMIGNIAHQWRQPLNIMALVMQDIYISDQLGNLTSDKVEESYNKANNLLQYMSQTIDDFRNFFKESDDKEVFSLKDAVESVYGLVSTNLAYHHITCVIDVKEDSMITGGVNEFKQVMINILNNAQEAIVINNSAKKEIKISISKKGSQAVILVQDDGGGIKKDVLLKIFDPYFTTKAQTQGTGLGLYMSKRIIENMMLGSLSAKNVQDGAEFRVALPLKD